MTSPLEQPTGTLDERQEPPMRVLICGSRTWPDDRGWQIRARLNDLPPDATVIHGDARGADRIAHLHAVATGRAVERFWPDWQAYGKRAGIVRNLQMLDSDPDLVLAFWDGKSLGTLHTITEARRREIPVEVISP